MSLMKRLFTSKNKTSKQAGKKKEGQQLSLDGLNEDEVLHIAQHSEEIGLREKAIAMLNYDQALLDLALATGPSRVVQVARQRVGQYLEEDLQRVESLIQSGTEPSKLLQLSSHSRLASERVIDGISDEKLLLDVAQQGATTQLRQKAAEKVADRESLEKLIKAAKDKDRSVYKITKLKLDVFKAADLKLNADSALAEELNTKLNDLVKKEIDASFKRRLQTIESSWQALTSSVQADHWKAYEKALIKCQEKIAVQEAQEKAAAESAEDDKQAKTDLQDIIKKTRRLIAGLYQAEVLDEEQEHQFRSEIDRMNSVANRVKERDLSLKTGFTAYYQLLEAANQLRLEIIQEEPFPALLQKISQNIPGIEPVLEKLLRYRKFLSGAEPQIIADAEVAIGNWRQTKKDEATLEKKRLGDISELLRKANWALDGGRMRQARGICKDIMKKQEQHPALPLGMAAKVEALEESIAKLGDWHDFAVSPKKQNLVATMEALETSKLAPRDLADKIKALQLEWKTLCKGGENQDEELWEKFQQAADRAWLPCSEYFEEQDKEREQNLQKRESLTTQMEEYYEACNWDNAVWSEVEKTLRVARSTWLSYWPIPRKNIKAGKQRFDAVLEKIHEKIKAAYALNSESKSQLVDQAEKLITMEDNTAAIDMAKHLQSQWKLIGAGERKNDQKLWKMFRVHCDAVFERRDKEYEAVNQQRNAEKDKALALLNVLEECLSKTGNNFFNSLNEVGTCKNSFQTLGEMPKNTQRKIADDFSRLLEMIEKKKKAEKKEQVKLSWQFLFDLSVQLGEYERAVVMKDESAKAKQESLKTLIAETTNWPAGGKSIMQARLNNANSLDQEKANENSTLLRQLCIRAELVAGVESPEEDKALRMEYQMSQLQKGFGGKKTQTDDFSSLALEWISIAGVESGLHNEWFTRFSASQKLE